MVDPFHPIAKLLHQDRRYRFDAYVFVFESLRFAQEVLGLGTDRPGELVDQETGRAVPEDAVPEESTFGSSREARQERHLTGQELCEAIRLYALEQYGYMAKSVLNHWGVTGTSDFGEIVFNLIDVGQMRKTAQDRREDFDNVFDFDEGLTNSFHFPAPE